MSQRILVGDCCDVLPTLDAESVHAVVTDPPYGIGFMGREWDTFSPRAVATAAASRKRKQTRRSELYPAGGNTESQGGGVAIDYDRSASGNRRFQSWCEEWASACFRVLKPGGHMVVCGSPRTFHRLTCAIEDAGFEIRDCLMWLYGSGFPKSLDVSKALDRMAGVEREKARHRPGPVTSGTMAGAADSRPWIERSRSLGFHETDGQLPVTELACQWDGWGTALKPAWEPIILARKPIRGSVAMNVTSHGTGALNIDGCRIGQKGGHRFVGQRDGADTQAVAVNGDGLNGKRTQAVEGLGRWPANVLLDEDAAQLLDAQSGESRSTQRVGVRAGKDAGRYGVFAGQSLVAMGYSDEGGASRFFYTAKASRSERNKGLAGLDARAVPVYGAGIGEGHDPLAPVIERNYHPTVKPLDLMQWLVRLITPPGGIVLDPFLGSGTTLIAADREGFNGIGVELDPEYVEISRKRICGDAPLFADVEVSA